MEGPTSESQGSLLPKDWHQKQWGKELLKPSAHNRLRKKLNKLNNLSHPAIKRGHFSKLKTSMGTQLHGASPHGWDPATGARGPGLCLRGSLHPQLCGMGRVGPRASPGAGPHPGCPGACLPANTLGLCDREKKAKEIQKKKKFLCSPLTST